MYKQADIGVVKFPFTDGTEFKKRPVLVISNESVNKTGDYLVIQITSKVHQDELSILIEDGDVLSPLPLKSYIRSHKIFTVHYSLILSKITSTNPLFVKTVSDKISSLISDSNK